jgi:hypothetical protein
MGWRWRRENLEAEALTSILAILVALSCLAIAAMPDRRERWLGVSFLVAGASTLFAPIAAGGDFMNLRLATPVFVFAAAPGAFVAIPESAKERLTAPNRAHLLRSFTSVVVIVGSLAITGVLVARPQFRRPHPETILGSPFRSVRQLQTAYGSATRRGLIDEWPPGVYSDTYDQPIDAPWLTDPVVIAYGIGLTGVTSPPGIEVYDRLGLANPFGSHMKMAATMSGAPPGHEKPLPTAWVAADLKLPVDATVHERLQRNRALELLARIDGTDLVEFAPDTEAAIAALACPALADLQAAASEELTPMRLLQNFVGSAGRTFRTFDQNPQIEAEESC